MRLNAVNFALLAHESASHRVIIMSSALRSVLNAVRLETIHIPEMFRAHVLRRDLLHVKSERINHKCSRGVR